MLRRGHLGDPRERRAQLLDGALLDDVPGESDQVRVRAAAVPQLPVRGGGGGRSPLRLSPIDPRSRGAVDRLPGLRYMPTS